MGQLREALPANFNDVTIIASVSGEDEGGAASDCEKNLSRRRKGVSDDKLKVQDGYLNFLRRERVPVAVHFFTGMQLRGIVRGFDTYTFVLELEGTNKQVLIFKHGVLYIDPLRPIGDLIGRLITETQQAEQAKQAQQERQQKRPRRPTQVGSEQAREVSAK